MLMKNFKLSLLQKKSILPSN